jgi:tetratricopeptide (TPR) repeat protein
MARACRLALAMPAVLLAWPLCIGAQQNRLVSEARTAFDELDYRRAAELAEAALGQGLSNDDQVAAYEVLGYSYGILNEADRAVTTLSQMIVLDPDREPNRQALPPRIASLWDQAWAQVLVVRGVLVDSVAFVAGEGRVTMHYEVSRPARARLRLVGNGIDTVIDSAQVDPGPVRYDWDALVGGSALPAGSYQLIVSAAEGRSEYQRLASFTVSHSAVDTIAHVTSIEGFAKRPETEVPPRDWRPLGVATLLTGAAAGAALALNSSAFDAARVELGVAAALTLGTGLAFSLRRPDARPVPTAIELNRLIDRTLADRNEQIRIDNEERRRRVRLTIVQVLP